MEMTRWRLSIEMKVGFVSVVRPSAGRSDGHQAMELHRHLTGGVVWSGGNGFHRTAFGH